jgi:hypothetical protein
MNTSHEDETTNSSNKLNSNEDASDSPTIGSTPPNPTVTSNSMSSTANKSNKSKTSDKAAKSRKSVKLNGSSGSSVQNSNGFLQMGAQQQVSQTPLNTINGNIGGHYHQQSHNPNGSSNYSGTMIPNSYANPNEILGECSVAGNNGYSIHNILNFAAQQYSSGVGMVNPGTYMNGSGGLIASSGGLKRKHSYGAAPAKSSTNEIGLECLTKENSDLNAFGSGNNQSMY